MKVVALGPVLDEVVMSLGYRFDGNELSSVRGNVEQDALRAVTGLVGGFSWEAETFVWVRRECVTQAMLDQYDWLEGRPR